MADQVQTPARFNAREALANKLATQGSLSEDEAKFFRAIESKERIQSGEALEDLAESDDELLDIKKDIERFSPALDLIGTQSEELLQPVVEGSNFYNTLSPWNVNRLPSPQYQAVEAGAKSEQGIIGEFIDGDLKDSIFEAMQNMKANAFGGPDFESFVNDVNRIRSEKEAKRGLVMQEFPESAELGQTLGGLERDFAVAIPATGAASKLIGSIPKLSQGLKSFGAAKAVGERAKSLGAVAAGAMAATAAGEDEVTLDELKKSGLTGAAFEAAMQMAGAAGKPLAKITKNNISQVSESLMNRASEHAFRVIQPVKKTLLRALERRGLTPAQIGRVLLEQDIIPKFPPFYFASSIGVKLDKALKNTGSALGKLRDEAEEYSDHVLNILHKDLDDKAWTDPNLKNEAFNGILNIEKSLKVDMHRVANRIRERFRFDPIDQISTSSQANKLLDKQIESFLNYRIPYRNIDDAIRLKGQFRPEEAQMGALTESQRTKAMKIVEETLADEIDNSISRSLMLKRTIGENPTAEKVAEKYGTLSKDMNDLIKAAERVGGPSNLPPAEKERFLEIFEEHQTLSSMYGILKKSDNLLFEKELATNSNNFFSLRDSIMAAPQMLNSPEKIPVTMVMNKFLREKGHAVTARSLEGLSKATGKLGVSIGNLSIGAEKLSNMNVLTPSLYIMMTRPDSPLNTHGFMVIDDEPSLREFVNRISKDDEISSIEKAKIITKVSNEKMIRVFNKDQPENKVETSHSLEGFRHKVENFLPGNK